MQPVSANSEQRLFVIVCKGGCTTLNFDNCFLEASQLARLLRVPPPRSQEIGTILQYRQWRGLVDAFSRHNDLNRKTWFHARTPQAVKQCLENARVGRQKLRLFYGDQKTGRSWLEECDVLGYISRSMGPMRVPILLEAKGSSGGAAILTHCLVRLLKAPEGTLLWSHRRFQLPPMDQDDDSASPEFPYAVKSGNRILARFVSPAKRDEWIAFQRGDLIEFAS